MPSKKRKYNQRFPAGRIKKIMQSDEEVGKVAQAVPIIISRTLELFVESLLNKTLRITNARNAKTLSPSHMKQCIMSETRFDFLKELVKNVPDINVDEMQTSADENIATDLTMPYHKSPVPVSATNCESSVSGTSKSIRSIPPFNGNTSTSTSNRNGNNRRSRPVTPTATSSTKLKPQPLLKTQSMDQSLLTSVSPTSSYHTPNFYTEISDSSVKNATTVNSVIQFTPKIQNVSNLDVRPPKLTRIDSAPGCLGDIQNAAYRTPLPQSDTPPVMTFDFTKTALPPPPLYTSINVKPPIPPLLSINNQASTSLHSPFLYPSTSSLTPPSPTAALQATPFVKIDACKPSVVKTNNCISSNSTTSALPSTSKPQAPILNIDLSNSFNISQPIFGSISTSNSLDMDEDYDNI